MKYGYSDTIIGKIFDEYSKELDSAHGPVIAPRVLGIDEKHIVHNMRAIFTDIENRVLLEMCPDNKKDTVIATIESMVGYDTNIEVVTMDMSCGYRTYVQECLPNAAIVVDKFHVCQSVYEKIAKARSKIMAYIGALIQAEPEGGAKKRMIAVRNLAQTNTYLFKFNAKNLAKSERRISAMANICATFPEFNHLRLIKERFDRIYTAPDRRTAEAYCKEWAELIPPSGCRQIEAWKKRFEVEPELFGRFLSREEPLPPVPVQLGAQGTVQPRVDPAEGLLLAEKSRLQGLEQTVTLPESAEAPVRQGDVLGTLTVTQNGETVLEVPIRAAETVEKLTFGQMLLRLARTMCFCG